MEIINFTITWDLKLAALSWKTKNVLFLFILFSFPVIRPSSFKDINQGTVTNLNIKGRNEIDQLYLVFVVLINKYILTYFSNNINNNIGLLNFKLIWVFSILISFLMITIIFEKPKKKLNLVYREVDLIWLYLRNLCFSDLLLNTPNGISVTNEWKNYRTLATQWYARTCPRIFFGKQIVRQCQNCFAETNPAQYALSPTSYLNSRNEAKWKPANLHPSCSALWINFEIPGSGLRQ